MNISRVTTISLALAVAVFALGYVNPSLAGKPGANCDPDKGDVHPSCKDDSDSGDGDDATYRVVIVGDVGGGSTTTPWSSGGGKKTISGRQHNAGVLTDLNPFFQTVADEEGLPFDADKATACFGAGPHTIEAGVIKPAKKGTVQASFWFEANTWDNSATTLFYLLHYTGEFMTGSPWLPESGNPGILNMTHWELSATNEGEDIKAISCIGEGATTSLTITVIEL